MKPEEARRKIDRLLEATGWKVQNIRELDLGASLGVAIRELPLKTGRAFYVLFVERKAVGVVEAKKVETTLSGVAEESAKYLAGVPEDLPHFSEPLPFAYETTGEETFFRDLRDPEPRSRRVFAFHRPETLKEWLTMIKDHIAASLRIEMDDFELTCSGKIPALKIAGQWRFKKEVIDKGINDGSFDNLHKGGLHDKRRKVL